MRLNKVSELIHNSTNHQNLDSAGVSVHFQEIVDLVIPLLVSRWKLQFPKIIFLYTEKHGVYSVHELLMKEPNC